MVVGSPREDDACDERALLVREGLHHANEGAIEREDAAMHKRVPLQERALPIMKGQRRRKMEIRGICWEDPMLLWTKPRFSLIPCGKR